MRALLRLLEVVLHRRGGDHRPGADDGDGRRDLDGRAAADEPALRRGEEVAERAGGARGPPTLLQLHRLLEALGERTACAEDQRLDGRLRHLELVRDLAVREPLPLAEEARGTLFLRDLL